MINVIRQNGDKPLLIILRFSALSVVVGYVIAFAAGSALGLILIYRHYRTVRKPNNKGDFGKVLYPMIVYGMLLYLSNTLSSLMITFRGMVLAYFTTNFTVLVTLISSPVSKTLFPAFSKLGNDSEAKIMFTYSVKYALALIIPAAVYTSIMSQDLIFLLYGARYSHAPLYLTLYALTFLLTVVGSTVLDSFFSGVGDSKIDLEATLLYAGFLIPLAAALTSTL